MYAVIVSGGKQYRVTVGQVVQLEKLPGDAGASVVFDQVLMAGNGEQYDIGAPYLANAKVAGQILEQGRHDKIKIVKIKRRKHHRKTMGHRQYFTAVQITAISTK